MQSAMQEPSTPPVDPCAEVIRLQDCLAESEQQRAAQETLLEERAQRIEQLLDLITLLKRKRFGRSADVISADQLSLFDEAELEALIGELEAELEAPAPPPAAKKPKSKPVRRPLPEHLPRVERVIDLSEDEKQAMGPNWTFIGFDEAEQLAVIPRQPYVIRVKRAKYAPVDDSLPGAEQGVVIAPRAPQILPKAIAHSSLLADVVVGKFVDALPLYRQEKIWAREGIDLARQTMAGWMIQLDAKLAPLMAAMKTALYQGRVIHVDETRLQVLKSPGARPPNSPSCGCIAEEPRTTRQSGSNMLRPAVARCRNSSCFPIRPRLGTTRRRETGWFYSAMATAPIRPWPCKLGSSAMQPAGRMCDANSSRPPKGASTPPPPIKWSR